MALRWWRAKDALTAAHGRVKCQSDSLPPPELSSGPGCPGHRVPGLAARNHTYTFGGRRLLLEGMHSDFLRGACCSLRVLNLFPPTGNNTSSLDAWVYPKHECGSI